jgi:hypothetical protein
MKFLKAAALMIGSALPIAPTVIPASATTLTLDWIMTVPPGQSGVFHFTGSGTVTVTTGASSYMVTGITGTVTDGTITDPITGLAPPGTLNGNDNLLFPIGTTFVGPPVSTTPYVSVSNLDSHGIAFFIASGTIDVFGFNAPNTTPPPNPNNNNYGQLSPDGFGVGNFAVPGPIAGAGLPGLLFACGGLLLLARRRQKTA